MVEGGPLRRLHRRAATVLEDELPRRSDPNLTHAIALHWLAGRDTERAFTALNRAATSSAVAHAETLQMYERLLELWDLVNDPEMVAGPKTVVLEAAARAAKDAGDYERAVELVTLALDADAGGDACRRFLHGKLGRVGVGQRCGSARTGRAEQHRHHRPDRCSRPAGCAVNA